MLDELVLDGPLFPGEQCWRCEARPADTRIGMCAPCSLLPFSAPSRTVEEPEAALVTRGDLTPTEIRAAVADDVLFPSVVPDPPITRPLIELAWLLAGFFDATATVLRRWAR